jgi:quaternary ammonium compound-resistance protein SugE
VHPWLALILAGIFELGFTTFMKLSEGFSRWPFVVGFLISAACSFSLLATAMKVIPLGTAYAVWTGIGAAGTAVVGIVFFKDSASFGRIFFLSLLVVSVIGLKWVSSHK